MQLPWLLLGDFNLIYKDEDKSNDRLNRGLMNRFRRALNHLQVKELVLMGRKFTWSNGQDNPTMTRIDRAFITTEFEQIYKEPIVYAQSSSISDHSPLLILPLPNQQKTTFFRFESHWVHMPGFKNCVQQAWQQPTEQQHNPLLNLHIKLGRTAKGLCKWSKSLMPQGKMAMHVCREVIAQLDKAQEERQLTSQEVTFRKQIKSRLLGLAAIEKSRACQTSRLTWLKKGDVNTKFFHIMANIRRKKNFIHALHTTSGLVTAQ